MLRMPAVCACLLALLCAPVLAQRGAIVASRNLAELTAQAETIVLARVVFAHVEPHPELHNLSTVVVTLRVSETLKGLPADTLTFRQLLWDPRDIADSAAYHRGDEVLLLLNKVNQYQLTSPAGLNQGRFEIRRDDSGNAFAINGHGNQGLFEGVTPYSATFSPRARTAIAASQASSAAGPIALDDLRQAIKDLIAVQPRSR